MEAPREIPNESNERELVAVGNFQDSLSAEAVRSCLEMEGIEAEVFDGLISATVYNCVFGGAKVMVPRCDESRARALLASLDTSVSEDVVPDQDELVPGVAYCPICHSRRVRSRDFWNLPATGWWRFAARWFFHTSVVRCRACGHSTRT
jgi:hypothetical protein